MLEDEAELPRQAGPHGRAAPHLDGAAGGLQDVGDQAEQRRLPAARRADQGRELTTRDVEGDVAQRRHGAAGRAEHHRDSAAGDVDRRHGQNLGVFAASTISLLMISSGVTFRGIWSRARYVSARLPHTCGSM